MRWPGTGPNRFTTTWWPSATACFTILAAEPPAMAFGLAGPLTRRFLSAPSAYTTHEVLVGAAAATTRPLMPATTMVTGSSTAATPGRQTVTITARTIAATVHGRTPKSAMPIAVTGTSRMPRPRRRSNRRMTRDRTMKRIHMSPMVILCRGPPLWGRT